MDLIKVDTDCLFGGKVFITFWVDTEGTEAGGGRTVLRTGDGNGSVFFKPRVPKRSASSLNDPYKMGWCEIMQHTATKRDHSCWWKRPPKSRLRSGVGEGALRKEWVTKMGERQMAIDFSTWKTCRLWSHEDSTACTCKGEIRERFIKCLYWTKRIASKAALRIVLLIQALYKKGK